MSGYFSEKRGLKNIYEKLCLKYSKILPLETVSSFVKTKKTDIRLINSYEGYESNFDS